RPRSAWSRPGTRRGRACARRRSSRPRSTSTTISRGASGWRNGCSRFCPTCSHAGSRRSPAAAARTAGRRALARCTRVVREQISLPGPYSIPSSRGADLVSDPSLAELGRIIRRIEEKTASRRGPSRRVSREDLLGGIAQETEQGTVLVVRHRFELAYRHGHQPPGEARELGPRSLALLTRMEGPVPDGRRLLYLDAETTGLAGGTGTYAFLVGVGFFDEEAFEVRQYFMRDLDEEPALLAALEEVFGRFDGI